MLQREHPGIAISVKTRQAIRTILNNARDVIHELKGGGLLDEAEAAKLESVIMTFLRKLAHFVYLLEKENLFTLCRRSFVKTFDEAALARYLQSFEGV